MGVRAFYLFGKLTDGSQSVYDSTATHDRVRLYFCDSNGDLPSNPGNDDLAIVKKSKKLMFAEDGKWVQIKDKE